MNEDKVFLESQVRLNEEYLALHGHGSACPDCRFARLMATVAQAMLDRGDAGAGAIRRWCDEVERQRRQLPSLN